MAEFSVHIEGIPEAIAALEKLKTRLIDETHAGTKASGDFLQQKARSNFSGFHPYGYPHMGGERPNTATGNLQRSITVLPVVTESLGRFSVTVGPTVVYARIIELGGTITPKEAEYLSWFSPWLHRREYRKSVTLTGWPYFGPAVHTTTDAMNPIFEHYWRKAIDG